MKERLLGFVDELRAAGVVSSVSESMDAMRAIAAVGVERAVVKESLAATLVKDHADREVFEAVFERYFAAPARARGKSRREPTTHEGLGAGRGEGEGRSKEPREGEGRGGEEERREAKSGVEAHAARSALRLSRNKSLAEKAFRDMSPREVEEARDLVRELGRRYRARRARRMRGAKRGRLDLRRTFRRAMSRGGVPLELLLRKPRPGKTDLVALVDLSYSTETAAELLLALLAPARTFFRRVLLLAYVDAITEVSFENGHVVPHGKLDLAARSDFGRVLRAFDAEHAHALSRNTVLLVLGDARNNRRPPRADLLAGLRRQVRAIIWLNPEPESRWNTGDSTMAAYAKHVDVLLAASNVRQLMSALERI